MVEAAGIGRGRKRRAVIVLLLVVGGRDLNHGAPVRRAHPRVVADGSPAFLIKMWSTGTLVTAGGRVMDLLAEGWRVSRRRGDLRRRRRWHIVSG